MWHAMHRVPRKVLSLSGDENSLSWRTPTKRFRHLLPEKVFSARSCVRAHRTSLRPEHIQVNYIRKWLYRYKWNSQKNLSIRCEPCNKNFADKPGLMNHMDSHVPNEERRFQCIQCPRNYAKKFQLDQHARLRHITDDEKKFVCDECGKT